MKFRMGKRRYIWRPEIALANLVIFIGMAVSAMGIGGLIGFWLVYFL